MRLCPPPWQTAQHRGYEQQPSGTVWAVSEGDVWAYSYDDDA